MILHSSKHTQDLEVFILLPESHTEARPLMLAACGTGGCCFQILMKALGRLGAASLKYASEARGRIMCCQSASATACTAKTSSNQLLSESPTPKAGIRVQSALQSNQVGTGVSEDVHSSQAQLWICIGAG